MAGGARAQAPDPQAQSQHQNRHRHEPEEIGQRKPAFRHVAPAQRRPDADHRDHRHQRQQRLAGQLAHPLLQRAFAFHDQPRGAQQQIGHYQPQTAEQIEGGKPVQRRTGEAAVSHRKAVDKRADDNPLAEGRQQRAAGKGIVPEDAMRGNRFKTKFKGHAAKNQADEHRRQRDNQRISDHRIGQRKGAEQPCPAEHQPGFVTIPDGGDAVDHHIALFAIMHHAEQHPNT